MSTQEFVRALKPVVIEEGYPEETLDRWIQGIDDGMGCNVHAPFRVIN